MTETEWKASFLYGLLFYSAIAAGFYGFIWQSKTATGIAFVLAAVLNIVTRFNAKHAEAKNSSIRE